MAEERCIDMDVTEKQQEIQQTIEKATSKGHAGTNQNQAKVVSCEDILQMLREDKELLRRELKEGNNSEDIYYQSQNIKIQHVPEVMRQCGNFEEYFKPKAWAVGPIHAGDSNLSTSKNVKIKLAAKFVKKSGKKMESLLEAVREKIEDLKFFFDQQVISNYDDDSLAWLLFLDGCAILQFIENYGPERFEEFTIISNDEVALVQQDLFLLENQIPYLVLDLLMGFLSAYHKEHYLDAISIIVANSNIIAPLTGNWFDFFMRHTFSLQERLKKSSLPVHLLDLLRSVVLGEEEDDEKSYDETNCLPCIPCFGRDHRLPIFRDMDNFENMLQNMYHNDGVPFSFRNVQELKSAGIKLKPSKACGLRSVSFKGQCFNIRGELRIPPLIVENSTTRKLMNLVAYERCLGKNYEVISYLKLLDLLIDSEQDVVDLRRANVLRHRLSSDKEVAQLFNNLGSNILLLPNQDVYVKVARQIDVHCRSSCATWTAEFLRNHCSSPSTFLAFLLAFVAGFLTIRQFWSAIFPKEGELVNDIANFYEST